MLLLLISNPTSSHASFQAYEYAKANPSSIEQVFFYSDAVYQTLKDIVIPTDEFDITKGWQDLAKKSLFDLYVCIGSASRRGIHPNNIAAGFVITGMVAFMHALKETDNILTFD